MAIARLSRRDFLTLRTTERGRMLELSCRALFMRCADAAIPPGQDADYEPWMGEPPTIVQRRSVEDLIASIEADLADVQLLRLLEPEWLEGLDHRDRMNALLQAFERRGGRVERQP